MPLAEDAALWVGSHMRALRKQATSHCGGEKFRACRPVRHSISFLRAPKKSRHNSKCNGGLPFSLNADSRIVYLRAARCIKYIAHKEIYIFNQNLFSFLVCDALHEALGSQFQCYLNPMPSLDYLLDALYDEHGH